MTHTGYIFIVHSLYSDALYFGAPLPLVDPNTIDCSTYLAANIDPPYLNVNDKSIFYDVSNETVLRSFEAAEYLTMPYRYEIIPLGETKPTGWAPKLKRGTAYLDRDTSS
jgi:hypothetical protein